MKKIFSLCILSLFILSVLAQPGFCQKSSDILEKMIKANGGRNVLKGIKDRTFSGTFEIMQMGLSGTVTFYHKEPNKFRQDIEVMGMVITNSFDGEIAWATDPQTGSVAEQPDFLYAQEKRGAIEFGNAALLEPEKWGVTYILKEKEPIDGKQYLILEHKYSDGNITTNYIDPKTYLVHKTKETTLNELGNEMDQEMFFSDYKKVDGVVSPHAFEIFQNGELFGTVSVTEWKFNTGLEDSLFKMEE